MSEIIAFILYVVLVCITVMAIYSLRKNKYLRNIGGLNATLIFTIGSVCIPLFGIPLMYAALFMLIGLVFSVLSLVFVNRFFMAVSKIALFTFLFDIWLKKICEYCEIKYRRKKRLEELNSKEDYEEDENREGKSD